MLARIDLGTAHLEVSPALSFFSMVCSCCIDLHQAPAPFSLTVAEAPSR